MKNPREYKKPIGIAMGVLNVLYMVFALVIYRYCGSKSRHRAVLTPAWIASPALGSAGDLFKKICYGIAIPGLWISSTVNQHVSVNPSASTHPAARREIHLCPPAP